MKVRNLIVVAVLMVLFTSSMYGQTKNLRQFVRNLPAGYDTTGKHWTICQYSQAETHVLTENSVGSFTLYDADSNFIAWNANLGNFNAGVNPWTPGDTIVIIGSIDTAYISNPGGYGDDQDHCGFYWLYADTISQATPQLWQPPDTLRPLPQPVASQAGTNIEISILNPAQTGSDISMYAVLGYWLLADTTGSGTPNAFNKEVAFIPVQGGSGNTTVYSHPVSGNYYEGQTVVWAYQLVAVPDTGGTTCPGHATYYLSRNSNPLIIVGLEESSREATIPGHGLVVQPNPFTKSVRISCSGIRADTDGKLSIHAVDGRTIASFEIPGSSSMTSSVIWTGESEPAGTYFLVLHTGTSIIYEKIIKLH